jgi:antitoxin (DNA-binding transcriptional repressor) of toxin-antitoxin stability system
MRGTMKTISIRDLRLRWPAAERALALEHELVVTRDGQPVAKLVRVVPSQIKRKRWDAGRHKKWLDRFWAYQEPGLVERYLGRDRADRHF